MFELYQVIEIYGSDPPQLLRVLDGDKSSNQVTLIDIVNPSAWLFIDDYEAIQGLIERGEARTIPDPFSWLQVLTEEDIPDDYRAHRDKWWPNLETLVKDQLPELLSKKIRNERMREAAKAIDCDIKSVRRNVRRLLQRGCIANAVLPDYFYSGAPGVERIKSAKEEKTGEKEPRKPRSSIDPPKLIKKKRANHKKPKQAQSADKPELVKKRSPRVTIELRGTFKQAYKRFHVIGGESFRQSHRSMIKYILNKGYEVRNGVAVPIIPSADEAPPFHQYRYWCKKDQDAVDTKKRRMGDSGYARQYRPKTGRSELGVYAPGEEYQIDPTLGDIYLVSELDSRRIIGRPIIYIVSDVFSQLIVGFAVTLEGPSWRGASLALLNAMTNKAEVFAKYGLNYKVADWPPFQKCKAVHADRGDFMTYTSDNLTRVGIAVKNDKVYRPDLKGLVEGQFNLINNEFIYWLPGAVYKPREIGGPDYRLDASLTMFQFSRLMVQCIRTFNNFKKIKNYSLTKDMIVDKIEPYPVNLWEWGLENLTGLLPTIDPAVLRVNLLPNAKAHVTRSGIMFEKVGLHYTCPTAEAEQWFDQAAIRGTWNIDVSFNPDNMNQIFWRPDDNSPKFEVCELKEVDRRPFLNMSLEDIQDYKALENAKRPADELRELQAEAEFHAEMQHVSREAQRVAKDARAGMSHRAQTSGIRENRAEEKQRMRQENAQIPLESLPPTASETAPPDKPKFVYKPIPSSRQAIKEVLEEKFGDEEKQSDD